MIKIRAVQVFVLGSCFSSKINYTLINRCLLSNVSQWEKVFLGPMTSWIDKEVALCQLRTFASDKQRIVGQNRKMSWLADCKMQPGAQGHPVLFSSFTY